MHSRCRDLEQKKKTAGGSPVTFVAWARDWEAHNQAAEGNRARKNKNRRGKRRIECHTQNPGWDWTSRPGNWAGSHRGKAWPKSLIIPSPPSASPPTTNAAQPAKFLQQFIFCWINKPLQSRWTLEWQPLLIVVFLEIFIFEVMNHLIHTWLVSNFVWWKPC